MRRRDFIPLLGSAATWPLVCRAQETGVPTIGFLHVAPANSLAHLLAAFRTGLRQSGYIDGKNCAVDFRSAEGNYHRLPALATQLVDRRVAIIVTGGGAPTALAAKSATSSIPIVFIVGDDPVKLGLTQSLSRPGGNATGFNVLTSELAAKRVSLLHNLVPGTSKIALLVNPSFRMREVHPEEEARVARELGRSTLWLEASTDSEISAAFAAMSRAGAGALLVTPDPFFNSRRHKITGLATRYGIPALYPLREYVLAGGLMSYGTSLVEAYQQQGAYAGKILAGRSPAELPVVQLTKFELVINLKIANTLGINFPSLLLAIADEVIE